MPPFDGFAAGADLNQTLAAFRKSYSEPKPYDGPLRKDTVNIASGLINYDLQAPAKNLVPINTPIRNAIPRVKGNGDKATHWVAVTSLIGSGYDAMPYVTEGNRSGVMSLTTSAEFAPYTTLGEEINLTYEAWSGAAGFEDEKARNAIRLLQKMYLKEENAVLGGNYSMQLGTPTAPTMTVASSTASGTIGSGTYKARVVALTYEGYRNWLAGGQNIVTGLPTLLTVTDPVGAQFIAHGGSSNKSAAVTGAAITSAGTMGLSTPAVAGAIAYAWFVDDGASGNMTLQSVTTLNSVFLLSLTTTGQNVTAITADNSFNQGGAIGGVPVVTAMDGLMYAAYASASASNLGSLIAGAYVLNMPTGTAGTGTTLTASGRGSVVEIDNMLISMWNNYQVSPDVLYMNAQQIRDVTTKCLSSASAPLLTYFADPKEGYQRLMAGGSIEFYFNPFAMNGGMKIPVMIHPTLPPGVILAWCKNLPVQYQSPEVPNVAEVHTRRDYYQIDWPPRTRKFETGVYAEETLAVYAPFGLGILGNIAPG